MTRHITLVAATIVVLALSACGKSESHDAAGNDLSLSDPSDASLAPGQKSSIAISFDGKDVAGPLKIAFKDLPEGVTVANANAVLPGRAGSVQYQLVVAADAPPTTEHMAMVTLSAGERAASQTFKVDIAPLK